MSDLEQETRDTIKERYEERTGEELPDHVIDNLHMLTGISVYDLVEYRANEKLADKGWP